MATVKFVKGNLSEPLSPSFFLQDDRDKTLSDKTITAITDFLNIVFIGRLVFKYAIINVQS
jgi:hypothetical protein